MVYNHRHRHVGSSNVLEPHAAEHLKAVHNTPFVPSTEHTLCIILGRDPPHSYQATVPVRKHKQALRAISPRFSRYIISDSLRCSSLQAVVQGNQRTHVQINALDHSETKGRRRRTLKTAHGTQIDTRKHKTRQILVFQAVFSKMRVSRNVSTHPWADGANPHLDLSSSWVSDLNSFLLAQTRLKATELAHEGSML